MKLIKDYFAPHAPIFSWVMALMLLCITLGPSAKSIAISLGLTVILVYKPYRENFSIIFTHPIFKIICFILGVSILGCIWSVADLPQQLAVIQKYSKLLFMPLIALGFIHKKTRYLGIHAYLSGMMLICCMSFYSYFFIKTNPDPGYIFYNHIVSSYMMAFAAYLAGWLCIHANTRFLRLSYGILVLLFSLQVLALNSGRTGYFIYIILLGLFLIQHFSLKIVRYSVLLFGLSFAIVFQQLHSDTFISGIRAIADNIHAYQSGEKDTSIGYRLQFHNYAKSLFMSKPLLGHGTGSFIPKFIHDNPVPSWLDRPDPHSQYWHTASELGLLGLLGLILLFGFLIKISFTLQEMKPILQAVLLPFCIACFSDTMLLTSGIGYLFVTFTGLCLGEWVALRQRLVNTAVNAPAFHEPECATS